MSLLTEKCIVQHQRKENINSVPYKCVLQIIFLQ